MTNKTERIGQALKFLDRARALETEARAQDFPILAETFALAVRNAELYVEALTDETAATLGP